MYSSPSEFEVKAPSRFPLNHLVKLDLLGGGGDSGSAGVDGAGGVGRSSSMTCGDSLLYS